MGMRVGILTAVAVATAFFVAPASAGAVDIIESQEPGGVVEGPDAGFQAGVCTVDPCTAKTPNLFVTQAAGHAPDAFTQIIAKHEILTSGKTDVVGALKTILVDLPPGLSVNPQAVPQCAQFMSGGGGTTCPADTQVGVDQFVALTPGGDTTLSATFPVYNLVPRDGEPARFAFSLPLGLGAVFLNAGIAWDGDFHEYFTIHVPPNVFDSGNLRILSDRLILDGTTGQSSPGGALVTNPSTCENPAVEPFKRLYTTVLHADSNEEPAPENGFDLAAPAVPPAAFLAGSEEVLSPLPKGAKPEGCEMVPFAPSASVDPGTTQTDSPAGATIEVKVPFEPAAPIYQSNLRNALILLPRRMGINPSAATGLKACSDEQFGKGSRRSVDCPAASKIGTVAIDTPPLPDGTLKGDVFLGKPLSQDPTSGDEFRVFLDAESASRGISVRLIGNLTVNPRSGQIATVIHDAPQLPFSSIRLELDGGPKAALTSPPVCGPNVTVHAMTAWSRTPDHGPVDQGFTLANAPGGGPCAKTPAERPFSPTLSAGPKSARAGAFSPFSLQLTRGEGQQELKGLDLTLAPGASAKLAGVPYCPEAAIAAAASRTGKDESGGSSCPPDSLVGSATIAAGSGPSPLQIAGKVFLAGPYRGAPLSLLVITPALAGPFDLGTVVVRVAVSLDPETAQIDLLSDAIPDILGGVRLDLRSVAIDIDRDGFTLNGTNCSALATAGSVAGAVDPSASRAVSVVSLSAPSQLSACKALGFKPKLSLRLSGATRRGKHPTLRAVLKARSGDANLAGASVVLPHALFLDQANLARICTRVQFAAQACPKRSTYGRARAVTPLLDKPLTGRVYLRASSSGLPDLVAHLEGQVGFDVVGRVDSVHGAIRTTFRRLPDVPLTKFTMTVPGGKHGLLIASRSLCQGPVKGTLTLKGQNKKKLKRRTTLNAPCDTGAAKKTRGSR
jgi:hypothetical protein